MNGVARALRGFAVLSLVSCNEKPAPPASGSLPPGVAARVGSEDIAVESIQRIAAAQRLSLREARDRAIADALFALEFRAAPERRAAVATSVRGVLARSLLERIEAQARAEGPPTDAEVALLTQERWTELDRPRAVRTTHAVVRVQKPADRPGALSLSSRLQQAVQGSTKPDDFMARAKTLSTPELEVRPERLPLVTADGRSFEPSSIPGKPAETLGTLDPTFTRAAQALSRPGEQSPVVETSFGFHVILLEEVLPEARPTLEERRRLLAGELTSRRAKRLLSDLDARLRASTPVEEPRDVETLTALVPVRP